MDASANPALGRFLDDDALVRRSVARLVDAELPPAATRPLDLAPVATVEELRAKLSPESEPPELIVCDFHLDDAGTSEAVVRELVVDGHRVSVMTSDPLSAAEALGNLVPILRKPSSPTVLRALLDEQKPG